MALATNIESLTPLGTGKRFINPLSNKTMNNSVKVNPVGYEQLTVSTSSVPLISIPAKASRAIVMVEAQPLRYREDGTAPTASVGVLCVSSTRFELESRKAIQQFRAIRSGGTDSVVSVLYYS